MPAMPAMPTKRKLDDITAELPSREALDARIQLLFPSSFPPRLLFPWNILNFHDHILIVHHPLNAIVVNQDLKARVVTVGTQYARNF
jgi:hypothetical protein